MIKIKGGRDLDLELRFCTLNSCFLNLPTYTYFYRDQVIRSSWRTGNLDGFGFLFHGSTKDIEIR